MEAMTEHEVAVFRLACAYGLADTGRHEWPTLPLFSQEDTCMPTARELDTMERMWARGFSAKAIAAEVCMTQKRVEHIIRTNRDRFPYRRGPYRVWSTVRRRG